MKKNVIYIVGIGPGDVKKMTVEAYETIYAADVIIGYGTYVELVKKSFPEKSFLVTPMTKEVERCRMAYEEALRDPDKTVAVISSGDAGVYGMASIMYELSCEYPEVEVKVIPGVTAAISGSALLGSPIANDFAVISMSDRLTPFEVIEKRLIAAASADFGIVIYNPESHGRAGYLKKACDIIAPFINPDRPCGITQNIARVDENCRILEFRELQNTSVDMFTTVFIPCSNTVVINNKLVTKRGYVH